MKISIFGRERGGRTTGRTEVELTEDSDYEVDLRSAFRAVRREMMTEGRLVVQFPKEMEMTIPFGPEDESDDSRMRDFGIAVAILAERN